MSKFKTRPTTAWNTVEGFDAEVHTTEVFGESGPLAFCHPAIADMCAASPLMLGTLRRVQQMMRIWPIEDGSEQYDVAVAVDNAIKAAEGKAEDAS